MLPTSTRVVLENYERGDQNEQLKLTILSSEWQGLAEKINYSGNKFENVPGEEEVLGG